MGKLFGETDAISYDYLKSRLVRMLLGANGDARFHNEANNGKVNYLHFAAHYRGNVLRLLSSLCRSRFPSYRVSSAHRVNSAVNTIGIPLANGLMQDHGTLIQRLRLFCSVVCFG